MNNYGALFTKDTSYKTYATPVETDKDILTMALTRNYDGYNTGAIVDQDGKVYTVGYNANGEMGNETTQNLTTPWCISKLKIETNTNIINYKNIGDNSEKKITYKMTMGFNLIKDSIEGGTYKFSTIDEKIATVSENGTVTATGIGTTFIKIHNIENNIWAAIKKVNVNGKQGNTQPKSSRRIQPFCSTKSRWNCMGMGLQWIWTTRNKRLHKQNRTNTNDTRSRK